MNGVVNRRSAYRNLLWASHPNKRLFITLFTKHVARVVHGVSLQNTRVHRVCTRVSVSSHPYTGAFTDCIRVVMIQTCGG
jgi:hypothetical protein